MITATAFSPLRGMTMVPSGRSTLPFGVTTAPLSSVTLPVGVTTSPSPSA